MLHLQSVLFGLALLLIIIAVFVTVARFHRLRILLQYVEMEINRTQGHEQTFWRKEKRRLIRTFLTPFRHL